MSIILFSQLVEFFEAKFQIYANQLTRVKDAIVGSYNQDEYPLQYPSCCEKKKQEVCTVSKNKKFTIKLLCCAHEHASNNNFTR